jgi:hypothetical protein
MRYWLPVCLLLVQSCASGPRLWTPAARPSAASCSVPGQNPTTLWRLVSAQGFTFCVPGDWETADGRTWRGAGGSITWGTGFPPRQATVSGTVVMRVPANRGMPSEAEVRAAVEAQLGVRCSPYRLKESIGGAAADLYDTECNGQHHTGARWESPAVFFQGQADSPSAASLQLQVYRTTRFTTGAAP